jgi:O-antigen ligase
LRRNRRNGFLFFRGYASENPLDLILKATASIVRSVEIFSVFLLAAAFATIQVLIGGTRLLFSFPAYGLLGLIGLLSIFSLRRAKPTPNQICLASSAIFFGYILARALVSPVDYVARPDIYSVLGGLLVYFFVACVCTDAKQRMAVLLFLLALALAHVFIGALQFRDGNNFMPISFLQRHDYGRRASGFYVCPNHLAGLLEVLGVFGLSMVCWSRWPTWAKLLIGYAVAICYLGVVLTGSRGGYLSTGASLLVFAALSLWVLRAASASLFWKIGGVGFVAAVAIAVAVVFFVHKSDYLSDRAHKVYDPTNERLDFWKAAVEQWKLQPLVGTGSGTYLYYGRQFRTERVQRDPVEVHNDYLHLLAEYGVVGGVFFLIFFAAHLRNGWKNFQRLGPKHVAVSPHLLSNGLALNLGAIAAVSAYVVHSAVDFNLHIPANVLLLGFVFGVLANAGTQRGAEPLPPSMSILAWRLALPVIGAIVAIQSLRLLPGEYFAERARTALRDSQRDSAALFALRGLASERRNPDLYQYLGSARIAQTNSASDPQTRASLYEAAIPPFEAARALAPRDKTFASTLGFIYDMLGRFPEAEWMFDEALALDPRSKSTRRSYRTHLARWRAGESGSTEK